MSNSVVKSVSEPWILLPHLYSLKNEGVITDYAYFNYVTARDDLFESFPNGKSDYVESLRHFAIDVYSKLCEDHQLYFLDKTPRYYLISEQIHEVFPEAKVIYLFRNPLAVFSSIIETFCQGKLRKLFNFHLDIYFGQKMLIESFSKNRNNSIRINYEDLVSDPEGTIAKLSDYLNLEKADFDIGLLDQPDLTGKFGDPKVRPKDKISRRSLDSWTNTFHNLVRQYLAKGYLHFLGIELIEELGYDYKKLKSTIPKRVGRFNSIIIDLVDVLYYQMVRLLKPNIFFGKISKWSSKKFLS